MDSIYAIKRKEPRVKLSTRVQITTYPKAGEKVSFETVTIDISPRGASIRSTVSLPVDSIITFAAVRYVFETRAAVRSIVPDRVDGGFIVGVEYLDNVTNPIVVWKKPSSAPVSCEQ